MHRLSWSLALSSGCIFAVAAFGGASALGQETRDREALRMITETANQICQSAPLEQTNEGLALSGDAQAKVGGIVGRIANLGITGAGRYQSGHSMGVLQQDLTSAIRDGNNCKLDVFHTLERDLLTTRSTGSDATHGQSSTPGSARRGQTQPPGWTIGPVVPGTDHFAGDYEDFSSDSAGACREECSIDARCRAFSFANDMRHCWLKDRVTPQTTSTTLSSGVKTPDQP
jgi:hypothetical protein